MRAVLYARRSAADAGESVDVGLDRLRRHAAGRSLEVVEEVADSLDRHDTPRPGWRRVLDLVDSGRARAVVVESLVRLFPREADLVAAGRRWLDAGVALISLDDVLDTSRPDDRVALTRGLALLADYSRARHAEATRIGVIARDLAARGQRLRGRRVIAVDDLEVARLWESGQPTRAIVASIKSRGGEMSMGTLYNTIARLRSSGRLDDKKREAALGIRPKNRGGRPRKEGGTRRRRRRGAA